MVDEVIFYGELVGLLKKFEELERKNLIGFEKIKDLNGFCKRICKVSMQKLI